MKSWQNLGPPQGIIGFGQRELLADRDNKDGGYGGGEGGGGC
jgi:hypothetical protein